MVGLEPTGTSGASRRDLLVAASGVSVGSIASTRRVAAGTSETSPQEVTISRDEGLPSRGFEQTLEEANIPVDVTDRDVVNGIERFNTGETDIVHTRRPLLSHETNPINGERGDVGFESIAGTAFVIERGTWRSPLRGDERLTLRESNPRAETWAELTDRSAMSTPVFEKSAIENPARSNREVVTRGVRPAQYAEGHGGLGYYRLPADEIVSEANVPEGTTPTPLVQLQYTYVNGESLDRSAVERYLDLFVADARGHESLEPFSKSDEQALTVERLY